jgi:sulfatase maturation enzyme AslB (radical SAM superfamily)
MNNFCPAPWIARFFHPDGNIAPCCFTSDVKTEADIDSLKTSFLAEVQDKKCSRCWTCEKQKIHSPRNDFVKLAGNIPNFTTDGLSLDTVTHLSLELGNYCNAECIICNGSSSSRRNTWSKIHNKKEYVIDSIKVANLDVDFSKFKNLKTVSLIGGEPSIHPATHMIIDKFINNGTAKSISLSFITNASKLDQKLLDKLKFFDSICVTLSIDGVGKYFDYQRRPLQWNTIKQVSNVWMEVSRDIIINYVVTAVSVWGFNEFIEWFTNFQNDIKNKNPQVILTHVYDSLMYTHDKEYLRLSVLTEKQKQQWKDSAIDHPLKQEIINMMDSAPHDPLLLPILNRQIKLEDSTSKLKFVDVFPDWNLDGQA